MRAQTLRLLMSCFFVVLLAGISHTDDLYNLASTHNGVGGISTSTVEISGINYRHVGAGMQPGGVLVSTNDPIVNHAGFLQAGSVKYLDKDTDADGIPDELDEDNDNDALSDRDEIDGSAFSGHASTDPNNPDTDNDGMSDTDEARGMYDPLDPNHRLEVTAIAETNHEMTVQWIGKGGGTTNILTWSDDPTSSPVTNVLTKGPYSGGEYPWYKATNVYSWTETEGRRVVGVETE
ncbi:MAG: hypothetical protein KJ626_04230 [Verrucomicrobia bacterium]|nr:hypothetical protein [Verrucomicrobiota bacterium]